MTISYRSNCSFLSLFFFSLFNISFFTFIFFLFSSRLSFLFPISYHLSSNCSLLGLPSILDVFFFFFFFFNSPQ
ncbi:hypothetical protein BDW59DRAFT_138532 [Aspergillus cavernicola]|uniref:Uncharacterized protein n=1 Tax=Aspergillus cavernicola TaxID=176166 RepID=A0ABR4IZZ0_9EURO